MDSFFANDLNTFKAFDGDAANTELQEEMLHCQTLLHTWSRANRVVFDPSKESFHVLHRRDPAGENFTILGVSFDGKLLMHEACHELAVEGGWRTKALLRSRRYYDTAALLRLFKSHVLPFLESATPAVYHASRSVLAPVDNVLDSFLRRLHVTSAEALLRYNLAPLCSRRDMAMLGLLHRTVLGRGPPHFRQWFVRRETPVHTANTRLARRRHDKQLHDPLTGSHSTFLARSAFGLVKVYNSLPQQVVDAPSVKLFQRALQDKLKELAAGDAPNWECFYSTA